MNTKEWTTNSRGHIRWSEDDRKQLLEEYSKSGQTKKAFCMERGVNLGTFYGWHNRAKQKGRKVKTSKPAFREVHLPVSSASSVEIVLPGGARICLNNTGKQEDLIKLIRGVAGCRPERHKC